MEMEYTNSEYVELQDPLKDAVLYPDRVSIYASPSLEEVMQDASFPHKPKSRLNAPPSVEEFGRIKSTCPSMTSLSDFSMLSEQNVSFVQKSNRAKVACLLDAIDKFLGGQSFNQFMQYCKENDQTIADDILTCLSSSPSNESIGKASTFSDDQKQLSALLNSYPPKNDDDIIFNHNYTGYSDNHRDWSTFTRSFEKIHFKKMQLSEDDYGPEHLVPDCYVRDEKRGDTSLLLYTPWNFDLLATTAAQKCTGFAQNGMLIPTNFTHWNI